MEVRAVETSRILNPTSIDLGEYVINPYRGCEFSCLYCYVRYNRVTQREARKWGEYVDVRVNAPSLLEKELARKKPGKLLLGSTTECFQPQERQWQITEKVLKVLNNYGIAYTILTRSPLIVEAVPLLRPGLCRAVYFTINQYSLSLKCLLEPKSPPFEKRIEAILALNQKGIPVIPYVAPILPFITDIRPLLGSLKGIKGVEGEGLNFNLGNIQKIIEAMATVYPQYKEVYQVMLHDQKTYNQVFTLMRKEMVREAIKAKMGIHITHHTWRSYFENRYS